jgi:hypothetical protein
VVTIETSLTTNLGSVDDHFVQKLRRDRKPKFS